MENTVKNKIQHLEGLAEVRSLQDNIEKAVHIVRYYSLESKIRKNDIVKYFNISSSRLRKRLWSHILGYTEHTIEKPKYIPPFLELGLVDLVQKCRDEMKCLTKEELIKEVL